MFKGEKKIESSNFLLDFLKFLEKQLFIGNETFLIWEQTDLFLEDHIWIIWIHIQIILSSVFQNVWQYIWCNWLNCTVSWVSASSILSHFTEKKKEVFLQYFYNIFIILRLWKRNLVFAESQASCISYRISGLES